MMEGIKMAGATVTRFYIPTKIVRGIGALEQLGAEAKALKARRALIVTDKNLVNAGLIGKVEGPLRSAGIGVGIFDEGIPDPTVKLVERGLEVVKKGDFDLLVGVGGGSNIDAAKGIAVLANNPGSICDYEGSEKF